MATGFIVFLFSISAIQIISCSTYCDFKKIFQTPVDSSRFDNYEILERANFDDDTKKSESMFDSNLPKAFANAQVLVHVQNDKSRSQECYHSQREPCIRPSFCQFPFPCHSSYPYPYPFPTFNPYIPVNSHPMYPPFNPFGNFQYPQWTVPPPVESKLVLDQPLVVLDEEIPCDTMIKTCECDNQKDMFKHEFCNKEEEMIEKILNCGHIDEDDCEGTGAKPLDDCDCPKKYDICLEIPTEIEHDCPYRKIIIDEYPPAKIPIPSCLSKECEIDERPSEIIVCPHCKKDCDTKYCLHCEKIVKEPCVLEIPIQGEKPYLNVKPSNENCCPYCRKDTIIYNYCSHCKKIIPDISKPCDNIDDKIPQYPTGHCNVNVLPSCTILVDPAEGPPSSDCKLIDVDLIDLEKLPTRDLSDILEREKLRKCQQGTQKCYHCPNCRKVRPLPPIKHYKTEEYDDEKLPGILNEDDDGDDHPQVFIYDPNMNSGGCDNVKEITLDEINKATDLVLGIDHLKDLTVDNTEDNIDDLIVKTDYLVPEEDIDKFLENIRKRKKEGKYYFLDGSKIGQGMCGCNSCCCSRSGTKKRFKYDIDDLNEQVSSKCHEVDVLLPKSAPSFDPLYVADNDHVMEVIYNYPNPIEKVEVPRYRVIPTVPSLTDKRLCCNCGHTQCLCNSHQIDDCTRRRCSCGYHCSCQPQVRPVRRPCNQGHYFSAYCPPDNYFSNFKAKCRCDRPRMVPEISTNINRSCSTCAPYVGELVTLSTY